MESLQPFEHLSYSVFKELIRGALRNNNKYQFFYNQIDNYSTEIRLNNFQIESDPTGQIEISQLIDPLILIFNNCKLPTTVIKGKLQALKFNSCDVHEIIFETGSTTTLEILGEKSKIGYVKIRQGLLNRFFSDCYIDKIELNGAEYGIGLTIDFNGIVNELYINSISSLNIKSNSSINKCFITNSRYPFKEKVSIKELVLINVNEQLITIEGLFGNIKIESFRGSLIFKDCICLENVVVIDQNQGHQNDIFNEFRNVYIGGKATMTRCDVTFFTSVDNLKNKHLIINEIEFNQALQLLEFKTLIWEAAININKLSFNDIHFSKDTFWSIQGLLCNNIAFNYFRNAGFGNISTVYGAEFIPIGQSYEEILEIYFNQDNLLDNLISDRLVDFDLTGDNGSLVFNYTDLGKINFIDVDFSNFTLHFNSTKLSEIYLAGSKLPKIVKASELGGLPESSRHQERIANSQLKKLHEQHGDILAANEYFSNEMNAYYHSMNWRNHLWEKLPLAFNKYSSNHGQSWIRALICTLVISLFFYCIFINFIGYHLSNPLNVSAWRTFFLIASLYLDFLNPIHKIDSFQSLYTNHGLDPELRFIDGIGRIFIAYCVYQLIQAFRKHGRSK